MRRVGSPRPASSGGAWLRLAPADRRVGQPAVHARVECLPPGRSPARARQGRLSARISVRVAAGCRRAGLAASLTAGRPKVPAGCRSARGGAEGLSSARREGFAGFANPGVCRPLSLRRFFHFLQRVLFYLRSGVQGRAVACPGRVEGGSGAPGTSHMSAVSPRSPHSQRAVAVTPILFANDSSFPIVRASPGRRRHPQPLAGLGGAGSIRNHRSPPLAEMVTIKPDFLNFKDFFKIFIFNLNFFYF